MKENPLAVTAVPSLDPVLLTPTAAGLFKVSGTSGLATFESLAALNPLEAPVPPRFLEELRPYRSHTARPLTAHVDDKSKSGGGRKRINVHDDYASLTLRASLLVEEIRRLA
jgi:hypothetical protein